MKLKYLLVSVTAFFFLFSGLAIGNKPEDAGNPSSVRPNARGENSNRQSDEYSLRGKERAEERYGLQELKKHKQKKDKKLKHKKEQYVDEYSGKHEDKDDRYEQRRNLEKYRNNPESPIIDQNVNEAKSKIDRVRREAIESIDNKTRELTGADTRKERTQPATRWWWPFGDE